MSDTCPTTPSSSSVCEMLDGVPGGWVKFLGHWMLRSALIMPGLAVAGIRDHRLVTASFLSSTFVSLFLTIYTVSERSRKGIPWRRSRQHHGFAHRQRQRRRALAARRQRVLMR